MRHALALAFSAVLAAGPLAAEELSVDAGDARLSGSFLSAEPPKALAVILPGSGPTDRNGNSPAGLRTDAYRLLAEALADQGIASLRADKRGVGASTGDGNAVTLDLYAKDAGLWIDLARDKTGLPCIWLIGHSEGGLVAMQTAEIRNDICGLILLAAPGRPVSQILLEQLRGVPALQPHMEALQKAMISLVAGHPVPPEDLPGPLIGIFAPPVQPFLMDLFAFAPAERAAAIDLPVLVVQGSADLQINPDDAELLATALPNGSLFRVNGMTHVLKTAQDETRSANLATYADPSLPLADGLAGAISDFILTPQ
ncbi:lysophospholipase [Mameliella alba]|nr:lysophospholipase [Mameliella alba]MBY6168312.1 lysophospholipase [Mameliella alba]MBY6173333.1 lysophospholipase [Mameliella alba]